MIYAEKQRFLTAFLSRACTSTPPSQRYLGFPVFCADRICALKQRRLSGMKRSMSSAARSTQELERIRCLRKLQANIQHGSVPTIDQRISTKYFLIIAAQDSRRGQEQSVKKFLVSTHSSRNKHLPLGVISYGYFFSKRMADVCGLNQSPK
jgi:hypothetical protein